MSPSEGRREANKQATRNALRGAAARLFAERGYEETTVADIARAAQVGERTFYRYFASKEELLAEGALDWIDRLQAAIRSRPAAETPYQAVAAAMTAMAAELAQPGPEHDGWILSPPQPLAMLRRVEPRPLRRLEQAITEAVQARLNAAGQAPLDEFGAQLLARVAVATLRTVFAYQRRQADGADVDVDVDGRLREAFARLSALTSAPAAAEPG